MPWATTIGTIRRCGRSRRRTWAQHHRLSDPGRRYRRDVANVLAELAALRGASFARSAGAPPEDDSVRACRTTTPEPMTMNPSMMVGNRCRVLTAGSRTRRPTPVRASLDQLGMVQHDLRKRSRTAPLITIRHVIGTTHNQRVRGSSPWRRTNPQVRRHIGHPMSRPLTLLPHTFRLPDSHAAWGNMRCRGVVASARGHSSASEADGQIASIVHGLPRR